MKHISTWGHRMFWAHRLSGLLLLGYLYLHLVLLSAILFPQGARHFNAVARVVEQPVFIAADLFLFSVILVHTLNGIRLILVDMGITVRTRHGALWGFMVGGAVLLFFGGLAVAPAFAR